MLRLPRTKLQIAFAIAVLIGGLATIALAQTATGPQPCPCLPNTKDFGYFQRTWRQWPGEQRPDTINPRAGITEVLPTPEPQEILPRPKAAAPGESTGPSQTPSFTPRASILPPETLPSGPSTSEPRGLPVQPSAVPPSAPPARAPKSDSGSGLDLPGLPGLPDEDSLPPVTTPKTSPARPEGGSRSPAVPPKTSSTLEDSPKSQSPQREPVRFSNATEPAAQRSELTKLPSPTVAKPDVVNQGSTLSQTASQQLKVDTTDKPAAKATPVARTHAGTDALPTVSPEPQEAAATVVVSSSKPVAIAQSPVDRSQSHAQAVSLIEDLKPERKGNVSSAYRADSIPVAASSKLLNRIATSASADQNLTEEPAQEPAMLQPEGNVPVAQSATAAASPAIEDNARLVPAVALSGYCPVELVLHGRWVQGDLRFTVVRNGMIFRLSGAEQRKQFLAETDRFLPVNMGQDVVAATEQHQSVKGDTTYCAIYQGRLYMFASAANQAKFNQNPMHYATK